MGRKAGTSEWTDDEQALLSWLPADGDTVSNPYLQASLEWDDERYYAVRDSLIDRGVVVRGRGRGGTVRLVVAIPEEPEEVNEPASPAGGSYGDPTYGRESDLYEPMCGVIKAEWASDHRANPLAVEVTAHGGSRRTGGTWSRPDLVAIEVRTYEYVPGKYLEVTTFEVKPSWAIDVQAVYEALAHRRAATRSYVIFHKPDDDILIEEQVAEVVEVALAHGIGVIVAADPGDYATWDDRAAATRSEPDPERLNDFIKTQLSETTRTKISRGLR